jgi:2-polyprenyl-3-methyl-5-hydroxy-6-metoxy-1,4-benzoquinol methylase
MPEIERRVPPAGTVLDVGCGHGLLALYLALAAPGRQISGFDVDADKIVTARRAAARTGIGVDFTEVEPGHVPDGSWDAITVVDVLYLLGADAASTLLEAVAGSVAPGGVALVKEIDVEPRWKYQLARAQELVATRVVRITEGHGVSFVSPGDIASVLEKAGLAVEHVPLHRRRLHPHHLVVGRRPGTP